MTGQRARPDNFVDVTTREFAANPIAGYDIIRRQGSMCWQPATNGWLLTRFNDAAQALRNPDFVEPDLREFWHKLSRRLDKDYGPAIDLFSYMPFIFEGRRHERLRRIMARAIAPFANREEVFAQRIAKLVAAASREGSFDLAEGFASRVLFEIMCDLMEIPEAERSELHAMSRMSWVIEPVISVRDREEAIATISRSVDFLKRHAQRQTDSSRPCLIGRLHGELSPDHADKIGATANFVALMLAMGNDAVASCITLGVRQMLGGGHSAQTANIAQEQWGSVSDDVIRYAAPIDFTSRILTKNAVVAGCPLARGSRVVVSPLAANHDPDVFGPTASEIRIDSSGNTGLTFGAGSHVCIGNRISRNVVKQALGALAKLPLLRLAGPAKHTNRITVRVVSSLPVEFK